MYSFISRIPLYKEAKDVQEWGYEDPRLFSVKSAYDLLANYASGHNDLFTCLWKVKTLPNVLTTAWRVLLDRVPTRLCLSRRGVALDSTLCGMCQAADESSQHLFLECKHSQSVWSLCFRWIDIQGVQHNDLKRHFESFHLVQVSNNQNLVWKGLWAAVI